MTTFGVAVAPTDEELTAFRTEMMRIVQGLRKRLQVLIDDPESSIEEYVETSKAVAGLLCAYDEVTNLKATLSLGAPQVGAAVDAINGAAKEMKEALEQMARTKVFVKKAVALATFLVAAASATATPQSILTAATALRSGVAAAEKADS